MNGIKILHAADLHLDSPFEGLPEHKAAQRRRAQRELLSKIVQTAEDEKVALILLAGDLLDSDSTYTETAEEIKKAFGATDIPVFIAPGNHDFYGRRSPYATIDFPENVHVFKSAGLEYVELHEPGVRVWGAAFTDIYSKPLLEGFSADKKAGVYDLMCIHGEVGKASQYNAVSEDDIKTSGMDYIALGHIHKESGLKKAGGTYYAWPGCPEGRGFDECGEKHVYVVELSDGGCAIKPVSVARSRYMILPVTVGDDFSPEKLGGLLPDDTTNDIYRIILRGETEKAPDMKALSDALEDRFFSLQLRDETTLRRDIWESAGADNLKGQFLQRLRVKYDAAKTDEERETITQAVRWGLAALCNGEEVVSHEDK